MDAGQLGSGSKDDKSSSHRLTEFGSSMETEFSRKMSSENVDGDCTSSFPFSTLTTTFLCLSSYLPSHQLMSPTFFPVHPFKQSNPSSPTSNLSLPPRPTSPSAPPSSRSTTSHTSSSPLPSVSSHTRTLRPSRLSSPASSASTARRSSRTGRSWERRWRA
jgi:hypothetical protein